jgi:7-cyano-7-deazaguanine synthase
MTENEMSPSDSNVGIEPMQPNDNRVMPIWVLLSGGMDSAACIEFYKKRADIVRAIHIDYGQVAASQERRASLSVARYYDVSLSVLEWRGAHPKGGGEIVGRNAFLLAASMMEIGDGRGIVAMGLHAGTPYFDCTEEFLGLMQQIADGYFGGRVRISAPFIRWSKRDIWEYCKINNVPIDLTYSCERGADQPCGKCLSCRDTEALRALQSVYDQT